MDSMIDKVKSPARQENNEDTVLGKRGSADSVSDDHQKRVKTEKGENSVKNTNSVHYDRSKKRFHKKWSYQVEITNAIRSVLSYDELSEIKKNIKVGLGPYQNDTDTIIIQ